jgi:hypothetical protein
MIFDSSYYNLVINTKEIDREELSLTRGYSAIETHKDLTKNEFEIKQIEDAISGKDDSAYGLKSLKSNIERIKVLHDKLAEDLSWIDEIKDVLCQYFICHTLEDIYICPVIGYDMGIGVENTVAINLNTELFLNCFKECISVILHEAVHVAFARKHRINIQLSSVREIIESLNYLIQYEGVAIYISKVYRDMHNLGTMGDIVTEDTKVTKEEYQELLIQYKKALNASSSEEALKYGFEEKRLAHPLGFYIVNEYAKGHGIDGVKEIISMNSHQFANKFLK